MGDHLNRKIARPLRLPRSRIDWNERANTEVAEESSETPIALSLISQRRDVDEVEGERVASRKLNEIKQSTAGPKSLTPTTWGSFGVFD
jgi:hypothetical protein